MRRPVLRARLLGPMDLKFGERQLSPLDSARAESLLAYLLLHRDVPQPRQRLAFLLWPDSAEGQAHTNLRKVLHNLRRALPDTDRLIEVGPRTLRWRPDAPLWLDVEQFERGRGGGSKKRSSCTPVSCWRAAMTSGWRTNASASRGFTPTRLSGSRASRNMTSAGRKPSAAPIGWSLSIRCVRRATGC